MTGLNETQLSELAARVHDELGGWTSTGRRHCLGLYRSVALVVFLLRENPTQTVAGAIFGISQATVSRRFEALRKPIADALAGVLPDPAEAARGCTVLVDGTLPTRGTGQAGTTCTPASTATPVSTSRSPPPCPVG